MTENVREDAALAHERVWQVQMRLAEASGEAGALILRTLVLVNGGSVLAMLAFMANVVEAKQPNEFDGVVEALSLFSFGVFFAVLTAGFTYFTNFLGTIAVGSKPLSWAYPYVSDSPRSKLLARFHIGLNLFTVAFGLISAALFLWGIFSLKEAMLEIL